MSVEEWATLSKLGESQWVVQVWASPRPLPLWRRFLPAKQARMPADSSASARPRLQEVAKLPYSLALR